MKLPKLPKLPSLKSLHLPSRITMERLLIVSAAALVVVLAVRGGQQTQTAMQQTDFTPDVSTQTIADASPDVEMTSTVCWYEDGEGYLVPVTRQIPLQDGVAKVNLDLCVVNRDGVSCGNCSRHCPSGAILMVRKDPSDKDRGGRAADGAGDGGGAVRVRQRTGSDLPL